jgi:putative oxidoreductase
MFITLVRTDNSPVQLFSRLALGAVMFFHGARKGFGWYDGPGFTQTLQLAAEAGIPDWATVLQISLELGGSLLLIVGLFTRLWAVGFAVSTIAMMFVAAFRDVFYANWPGQQVCGGFEYHLLVLGITAGLLIRGGGLLSVDRAVTPDHEVL